MKSISARQDSKEKEQDYHLEIQKNAKVKIRKAIIYVLTPYSYNPPQKKFYCKYCQLQTISGSWVNEGTDPLMEVSRLHDSSAEKISFVVS